MTTEYFERIAKQIHEQIQQGGGEPRWVDVLGVLVDVWNDWLERQPDSTLLTDDGGPSSESAAAARESFKKCLVPILTECFTPQHGHLNRCALLAAWQERETDTTRLCKRLSSLLKHSRRLLDIPDLLAPLGLRLEIMREYGTLVPSANGQDAAVERLREWLREVRRQFGCDSSTEGNVQAIGPWLDETEHLKVRCIRKPAAVGALNQQLRDTFETAVRQEFSVTNNQEIPWREPAVAYLADLLRQLQRTDSTGTVGDGGNWTPRNGHSDVPRNWLAGHAWILISLDNDHQTHPKPTGLLLLLRIDTIPEGCGAVYPDPDLCGFIHLDSKFQAAIRNAWQVVIGQLTPEKSQSDVKPEPVARRQDYRWSLTVMQNADHYELRSLPLFLPLEGDSGTLSFAAALRSIRDGIPLDRTRASTACFTGAFQDLGSNPNLGIVSGVTNKDDGVRLVYPPSVARGGRAGGIAAFVVATDQKTEGFPTNGLIEKAQFEEAWDALSEASRLTDQFNDFQRRVMQGFFQKWCFAPEDGELGVRLPSDVIGADVPEAGAYILNDFERIPDERDRSKLHMLSKSGNDEQPRVQPLPINGNDRRDELDSLIHGITRIDPDRQKTNPDTKRLRPLRILGDSGLGKTTLLHYIAWNIAGGRDGRIPILLQDLENTLKHLGEPKFWQRICRTAEMEGEETWLEAKAMRSEVVWLLDAVDQMDAKEAKRIAEFTELYNHCPIVMTLREAALKSRNQAWGQVALDTVTAAPFSEDKARRYLGELADDVFRLLKDASNKEPGSILTIPLLLHLLREFGKKGFQGSTGSFRNRYDVYRAVMFTPAKNGDSGGLFAKGFASLEFNEDRVFDDVNDAISKCKKTAWWHIRNVGSENRIPHDAKTRESWISFLSKTFGSPDRKFRVINALNQLNIVTGRSVLEDSSSMETTWRHRSFFEFLGGCRLAEMLVDGDETEQAEAREFIRSLCRYNEAEDRTKDWHWALRFALGHARSMPSQTDIESPEEKLALELIGCGNPWVVYEAIDRDQLQIGRAEKLTERPVELLVRWLVHRNRSGRRNYKQAWADLGEAEAAALTAWYAENSAKLGELLWQKDFRNASFLDPLLDLCGSADGSSRWNDGHDCQANPEFTSARIPEFYFKRPSTPILNRFLDDFLALPTTEFTPSPKHHDLDELRNAGVVLEEKAGRLVPAKIELAPIRISRFFVTNELYELYEPWHQKWHGDYSNAPDQPAVYISWYMARSFAEWLTQTVNDGVFRLPTEWEYECAVRWGTAHSGEYWWGDEWEGYREAGACLRAGSTRKRSDSEKAREVALRQHASWADGTGGLLDPTGNVWSWCGSRYTASGSSRVLRGSSFNYFRDDARAAYRNVYSPGSRSGYYGCRLVWLRGLRLQSSSDSDESDFCTL